MVLHKMNKIDRSITLKNRTFLHLSIFTYKVHRLWIMINILNCKNINLQTLIKYTNLISTVSFLSLIHILFLKDLDQMHIFLHIG